MKKAYFLYMRFLIPLVAFGVIISSMAGNVHAGVVGEPESPNSTVKSDVVSGLYGADVFDKAAYKPAEKASVTMLIENDLFAGHDRDYTNGFSLGYMSSTENNNDLTWLSRTMGALAGGTCANSSWCGFMGIDTSKAVEHQWGVSLTQLMFTPERSQGTREPQYGQHPYAGWLAIGITSVVKTEDRNNTLDVYVGMVGPAALGHPIQDFVHKVIDSPTWDGWSNQIPNEFAFLISFESKYRLRFLERTSACGNFSSDGYASWTADLGNVYIRGGVELYMRYGYHLGRNSAYVGWEPTSHAVAPFANMKEHLGNWSFYGFWGARCRASAYDIFLDGTMFRSSPVTVDKYPVVADLFAGVCLVYKDWDFTFGYTGRTKEYHGQADPQWMGCAVIRYSF